MNVDTRSNQNTDQLIHLRTTHDYEDLSGRFRLRLRNFERQFCNIYSVRIVEARKRVEKFAIRKWGKPVKKLMDLNASKGEKCVIVGTLYKHQELKPSILHDVSKEYQTVPPPARTHFVSDNDELILEDETQRVTLQGSALNVHHVVTGCVVSVLGTLQNNGVFLVEDHCWPEAESIGKLLPELTEDKFLVIISGIELAIQKNNLPLQLFIDWITGWSGVSHGFVDASRLVHVIFAGNCIRSKPPTKPKYGNVVDNTAEIEGIKELDYVIEQLIECIDVDVMPGEFDPTNHTFPQQPLHKCLFQKSARFPTLRSVSNPHACRIETRFVLGTSGQPIEDIQRYSKLEDPLDILEKTVEWAHIAPTAPDTLVCYPFDDYDPFLLTEKPHIYFAGNQPKFQTKLRRGCDYDTRLVCVPSFAKCHSFVLINLRNLECQAVSLKMNKNQD